MTQIISFSEFFEISQTLVSTPHLFFDQNVKILEILLSQTMYCISSFSTNHFISFHYHCFQYFVFAAGFKPSTGLATKIMVGAVAGVFTMFIVFIMFLWVFRHCAICWNSPTTHAQNTTQMRPVPTAEEIQPTAPPRSPSMDKDLPPSYESLFPNPWCDQVFIFVLFFSPFYFGYFYFNLSAHLSGFQRMFSQYSFLTIRSYPVILTNL